MPGYARRLRIARRPERAVNPSRHAGIRAFLDRAFLEHVRNGYQFSFIPGEPGVQSPASPMGEALYRDFTYVAIPVGNLAGRRSFTVYADGTIRFRADGVAPQKTDPCSTDDAAGLKTRRYTPSLLTPRRTERRS